MENSTQHQKQNPIKYRRGYVREDGFVFWQKKQCGNLRWVTKEKFDELVRRAQISALNWIKNNPERVKERNLKFASKRRELNRAYSKKWRSENPERCRQLKTQWRRNNPEKSKQMNRLYFERNPGAKLEIRNRYRARLANAKVGITKPMRVVYQMARRVSKCTGIKFDVDHIIPISKGGKHCIENIRAIPAIINRRKSNKIIHDVKAY